MVFLPNVAVVELKVMVNFCAIVGCGRRSAFIDCQLKLLTKGKERVS